MALKDTMAVSAYRGAGGGSSVTGSALTRVLHHGHQPQLADGRGRATRLLAGELLVRALNHGQTWTSPANATTRRAAASTTTNKISSLIADSNGPVATGTAAARVPGRAGPSRTPRSSPW